MKHRVQLWWFALWLFGCPPTPPPGPKPPEPVDAPDAPESVTDAGTDVVPALGDAESGLSDCAGAWWRIRQLSCESKVRQPKIGTWVVACENAELHAINMNTFCVIHAPSCAAVTHCLAP